MLVNASKKVPVIIYFCGEHYTFALTDVRLQFNEQSARVCPGAKTSVVDNLGHHKSFRSHHCIQYRDEIRVSFKGTKALNRYPNKLTIMMIEFYRQKIMQIMSIKEGGNLMGIDLFN